MWPSRRRPVAYSVAGVRINGHSDARLSLVEDVELVGLILDVAVGQLMVALVVLDRAVIVEADQSSLAGEPAEQSRFCNYFGIKEGMVGVGFLSAEQFS
jgi:hypothetical protein